MKVKRSMLPKDIRKGFYFTKSLALMTRRKPTTRFVGLMFNLISKGKKAKSVKNEEHYVLSSDGKYKIRVHVYRPLNQTEKLPVMLYSHGGGYVIGNPEQFNSTIEKFIETRPCVVISPDYRKAYTAPFPAGFNDCYETMLWAKKNADKLMITDKFITAGHSAGGGMTAALSLKARDTKDIDIAFQLPIYPMIDDQQPYIKKRDIIAPAWDSKSNKRAWKAYLDGVKEITPYAAPARCNNYKNLPPTITFVGEYDPFLIETRNYVKNLEKENIDVAFKVYVKAYHGVEALATKSEIAKDSMDFMYGNYAKFYDKYL